MPLCSESKIYFLRYFAVIMFILMVLLLFISNSKEEEITSFPICICSSINDVDVSEASFCCESLNGDCLPSFKELNVNDINNSIISICSENYTLSTKLVIHDVFNITITGNSENTFLSCAEHQDTGIEIFQAENIEIANIIFSHCGALYNSTSVIKDGTPLLITSALHVEKSTDVRIQNVRLIHGNGTGLIIIDSQRVSVMDCLFEDNKIRTINNMTLFGGGGIYIDLKNSENVTGLDNPNHILIERCNFTENDVGHTHETDLSCGSLFMGLERGGGIAVYLRGLLVNTTISFIDIEILRNRASWGGGMYLLLCDKASRNSISIRNSRIQYNCGMHGGGGIHVEFITNEPNSTPTRNNISCESCLFEYNEALTGGGISIHTSEATIPLLDVITFASCQWYSNKAYYGSAVDLTPNLMDTPTHRNIPSEMLLLWTISYQHPIAVVNGSTMTLI